MPERSSMGGTMAEIITRPRNTFEIQHTSGSVYMAPYMVHTLLPHDVLTPMGEFTYRVIDEEKYWKLLSSLS